MKKITEKPKKHNFSEFLESTKLSRRAPINSACGTTPKLPAVVCGVCDGKLENITNFSSSAKVCPECLSRYAKTESVLNAYANDKIRQAQLIRLARGGR